MDALELTAFCAWCFAVALAGGVVGLVFGNLRLPAVLLVASHPAAGAGANIGISGAAAIAASVVHVRAGRINWRLFAWMAPPSFAGGIVGGVVSGLLPDRLLLAAIGLVILYGAVEVLRYRRPTDAEQAGATHTHLIIAAVVGFAVGVLGGFVGLILGSLRLPAMVKWVGVGPYAAVGTNAAVGVVVGVGGLIGHLPSGIDWDLFAVGCAGAVPGSYLGARLTGRLSEEALLRAMAAVLAVTGLAMLAQAIVG
jgi:uncharacterized protein